VAGEVAARARLVLGREKRIRRREESKGEERKGKRKGWEEAYPSTVSRMLMSRSAPQPATRKTPTGGTALR
jgi:hypothetical protein